MVVNNSFRENKDNVLKMKKIRVRKSTVGAFLVVPLISKTVVLTTIFLHNFFAMSG